MSSMIDKWIEDLRSDFSVDSVFLKSLTAYLRELKRRNQFIDMKKFGIFLKHIILDARIMCIPEINDLTISLIDLVFEDHTEGKMKIFSFMMNGKKMPDSTSLMEIRKDFGISETKICENSNTILKSLLSDSYDYKRKTLDELKEIVLLYLSDVQIPDILVFQILVHMDEKKILQSSTKSKEESMTDEDEEKSRQNDGKKFDVLRECFEKAALNVKYNYYMYFPRILKEQIDEKVISLFVKLQQNEPASLFESFQEYFWVKVVFRNERILRFTDSYLHDIYSKSRDPIYFNLIRIFFCFGHEKCKNDVDRYLSGIIGCSSFPDLLELHQVLKVFTSSHENCKSMIPRLYELERSVMKKTTQDLQQPQNSKEEKLHPNNLWYVNSQYFGIMLGMTMLDIFTSSIVNNESYEEKERVIELFVLTEVYEVYTTLDRNIVMKAITSKMLGESSPSSSKGIEDVFKNVTSMTKHYFSPKSRMKILIGLISLYPKVLGERKINELRKSFFEFLKNQVLGASCDIKKANFVHMMINLVFSEFLTYAKIRGKNEVEEVLMDFCKHANDFFSSTFPDVDNIQKL